MIGAIAGDVIGSVHEGTLQKAKTFPLFVPDSTFTDDTVLTVAIASAVRKRGDYAAAMRRWGRLYPHAGYGGWFYDWLMRDELGPYNSFGNGSAMRVSAVGWAFDDPKRVRDEARWSAEVTHNHPEGIKGAQAVAAAILLARSGATKDQIAALLAEEFEYDCSTDLDHLRQRSVFDVTCQGTLPAAAAAFLESTDFEDAIRNAVSLGGDTDTLACITGSIAEAYYGAVPDAIQREVLRRLDAPLRSELVDFASEYGLSLAANE